MDVNLKEVTGVLRAIIRAGRAVEELGDATSSAPEIAAKKQVRGAARQAAQLLASIEQRDLFGLPASSHREYGAAGHSGPLLE